MSADEQHEDHPPASESPFGSEDESGDSALLDADGKCPVLPRGHDCVTAWVFFACLQNDQH